jgi:hypothetical protein
LLQLVRREAVYAIDSSGRLRYEAREEVAPISGKKSTCHKIAAYNGKLLKQAVGLTKEKYTNGSVDSSLDSLGWDSDPREYISRLVGTPVEKVIADMGVGVVKDVKRGG